MFEVFDPAEKKLELRLRAGNPSLRSRSPSFWADVVRCARAEIVFRREAKHATSLLLSESSLFVFDQRLVMITCGRSTLVDAALHLVQALGRVPLESLSFQRRREEFDGGQRSSFSADARALFAVLPGVIGGFGAAAPPRLQTFSYSSPDAQPERHASVEIYMHDVAESAPDLGPMFAGFELDGHRFEPAGHSLNAVGNNAHRAVHVTPTDHGVYAGLDASDADPEALEGLVDRAVSAFRPRRWEVLLRRPGRPPSFAERAVEARVSYL